MPVELWIALILVTALVAGAIGYSVARRGVPKKSEVDALKSELEAHEKRASKVQANVTDHFEQSALLFGQLARDYRAFLEHFSESAKELGISEVKARELLERADRPLLGHASEVIDTAGEAAAEPAAAEVSGLAEEAAEQADAAEVAAALRASAPQADSAPAEAPTPAAAAQGSVMDTVEPPLIEDVVSAGDASRAPKADRGAADALMAGVRPAALKGAPKAQVAQADAQAPAEAADKPEADAQKANAQGANAQGANAQRANAQRANAQRADALRAKAQRAPGAAPDVEAPPKVVDVELDALGLPVEAGAEENSAPGRKGNAPRQDTKRAG